VGWRKARLVGGREMFREERQSRTKPRPDTDRLAKSPIKLKEQNESKRAGNPG